MAAARSVRARGYGRDRRLARDRGASAIELAILAPILLVLIWLGIQYALYLQGRQVALAAAQIGARVAREQAATVPGWVANARNAAESYYNGLGTKVLGNGIQATPIAIGHNDVQVTVTGDAASILFGLRLPIHETAGGPIECFRSDLNGGQLCPVA
jgi:Flp pilus assembly protein TadG